MSDWRSVSSSNISAVRYDPVLQQLDVRFKSGGEWTYPGVDQPTFDSMLSADSVGKFFHANIRSLTGAAPLQAKKPEQQPPRSGGWQDWVKQARDV